MIVNWFLPFLATKAEEPVLTSAAQPLLAANILPSWITFLQFLVQKKIYEGFYKKPICIC